MNVLPSHLRAAVKCADSSDSSIPTWLSLLKQSGSPKTLAAQKKIICHGDERAHVSASNLNNRNMPQTETNARWSI